MMSYGTTCTMFIYGEGININTSSLGLLAFKYRSITSAVDVGYIDH